MRIRPLLLGMLALLLLGATTPTGCTLPWQSLLGDLTATLNVHVVNKAYGPVSFSLTTSTVTSAAATAPATQPSGGSTLDKNGQYDTTFPCLGMPEVLALKATLTQSAVTGPSATSETLHQGADYDCGSEVTFTVREAARVGIVVGAEAH